MKCFWHVVRIERLRELLMHGIRSLRVSFCPQAINMLFNQLISPITTFRSFVINEWIMKCIYVPGRFPYLGMHQDRGIYPFNIIVGIDHIVPPTFLYVALQLYAQRTIVVSCS